MVTAYSLEINFVEELVKAIGSARDVAEFINFLVVTKDATLDEDARAQFVL